MGRSKVTEENTNNVETTEEVSTDLVSYKRVLVSFILENTWNDNPDLWPEVQEKITNALESIGGNTIESFGMANFEDEISITVNVVSPETRAEENRKKLLEEEMAAAQKESSSQEYDWFDE
jgi:hypothetical protein